MVLSTARKFLGQVSISSWLVQKIALRSGWVTCGQVCSVCSEFFLLRLRLVSIRTEIHISLVLQFLGLNI